MNQWERLINEENTALAAAARAVVIQIPTPHSILKSEGEGRFLVAYRESTIDFLGAMGGRSVAIEAKSFKGTLALYPTNQKGAGLKRHQRVFLAHHARAGGLSLVYALHEPTGARFVLPVDSKGVVAGFAANKRKEFSPELLEWFKCLDGEAWLDAAERLGLAE